MSGDERSEAPSERRLVLVPRYRHQGYAADDVAARRRWVEAQTGARLERVGQFTTPSEAMRGNVENPIGCVEVPLGVVGPLLVRGEHAQGTFYVPFATTEGTLVRSYERGMVAITKSGGAFARVLADENRIAPIFRFADVDRAAAFARLLPTQLDPLRAAAEATTRHGKLLRVTPVVVGREVIVDLVFSTGDAHGMNLVARAADAACGWIESHLDAPRPLIMSTYDSEKRASGAALQGGKGKTVIAGATLPAEVVETVLHTTPREMEDLWHRTVLGGLRAGVLGYNGHLANGLAAIYIACGQDVASIVNAAVGVSDLQVTHDGDLHASVTLPSLVLGTVGGGTRLGTAVECLAMLGCDGTADDGRGARKLAEIVAATLLAGEISLGAAMASGEFVAAHEAYGRNRPDDTKDGG